MITATYSPDDNKLRLYSTARLDPETCDEVKAAGFIWAPKQQLWVAPTWTPAREDLLLELAGQIDDEDTSLVERAEQRADRFDDYADRRTADAGAARAAVAAIADNIPLGQPILVGHHSERRARKDAERIQAGMRRAVRLWETAGYWQARAEGAIRAAKYKERPDVRARRIKALEAEQRRQQRAKDKAEEGLKLWEGVAGLDNEPDAQLTRARRIAGCTEAGHLYAIRQDHSPANWWSAYDVLQPDDKRYARCPAWTVAQVLDAARDHYPRVMAHCDRWLAHIANRLAYERAMLAEAGGTAADQVRPEPGGGCQCWCSPPGPHGWSTIRKVNRTSVTVEDNWRNGGKNFTRTIPFDKLRAVMSAAEVAESRAAGRLRDTGDGIGFVLLDQVQVAHTPGQPDSEPTDIAAMRTTLRDGIKVAAVPSLFPTPPDLAARMVELADIQPGHQVLEPSAGTGNLVRAIVDGEPRCEVCAIEVNPELAERLRQNFPLGRVAIRNDDFLAYALPPGDPVSLFDRVVMNPPFDHGADIKHIRHALTFLKPGGRLVALCANGPRQRAAFLPIANKAEGLPADTFADQGTGVSALLLVIDARKAPAASPPVASFTATPRPPRRIEQPTLF